MSKAFGTRQIIFQGGDKAEKQDIDAAGYAPLMPSTMGSSPLLDSVG